LQGAFAGHDHAVHLADRTEELQEGDCRPAGRQSRGSPRG
jgi:hypothetical protein